LSPPGKREGSSGPPVEIDLVWTVEEVATFLKVSKDWVYRRAASGELPSRKVGSHLRFVRAEVLAWLDAQVKKKKRD
jgi:excisionase family DNA binding protein